MKLEQMDTTGSEALLSEPQDEYTIDQLERNVHPHTIKLEAKDSNIRLFSQQYAHSYNKRLWGFKSVLEEMIKLSWEDVPLKKIADLCESSGQSDNPTSTGGSPTKPQKSGTDHGQHIGFHEGIVVAVIGTLFKQQPEKPSILQDLREEKTMVPVELKCKYISENDVLLLEDETTTVRIIPNEGCGLSIGGSVNGVVCALKGTPNINGKFEVLDVIYPTPKESIPPNLKSDVQMIFVSGLKFDVNCPHMVHLDLLFDYLQGLSGSPEEQKRSLVKKSQVFFLGNCFPVNVITDDSGSDPKYLNAQTEIGTELDKLFDQLSRTMEVFIIPGINDPTSKMLPQPKLHRCIFPKSEERPTFHSLCNPTRLEVSIGDQSSSSEALGESLDIILMSGENVTDAMRNCNTDCPIEMSKKLMEWGHLCPTAPDTIALQPGTAEDIFILKTLPNLFVVGNQSRFGVRDWKGTTIVSVPDFSETFTVAVLTNSMNVVPLSFKLF